MVDTANVVPLEALVDHRQINFSVLPDVDSFRPFDTPGGTKYETGLGRDTQLRALLVNRSLMFYSSASMERPHDQSSNCHGSSGSGHSNRLTTALCTSPTRAST